MINATNMNPIMLWGPGIHGWISTETLNSFHIVRILKLEAWKAEWMYPWEQSI